MERIARLSPASQQALALQKEAVLTAMHLAHSDRSILQEWDPGDSAPTSFLHGLPVARMREDPMVVHDLMKVPGFDVVESLPFGAVVLNSPYCRLTVILANRQPLEAQTGTDLIYFNETFRSFVMVQYKAMEKETENGEVIFRLPNQQLDEEIRRMDALQRTLETYGLDASLDGFRLNSNPFFLKLCSRILLNPDSSSLTPGMYIPLEYSKVLAGDPSLAGPNGGLRVSYQNARRYFDNTSFVALLERAWVGTTSLQSEALADVIRESIQTGKAVALAIKNGGRCGSAGRRRGPVLACFQRC